jgi:hypothetical protein
MLRGFGLKKFFAEKKEMNIKVSREIGDFL